MFANRYRLDEEQAAGQIGRAPEEQLRQELESRGLVRGFVASLTTAAPECSPADSAAVPESGQGSFNARYSPE